MKKIATSLALAALLGFSAFFLARKMGGEIAWRWGNTAPVAVSHWNQKNALYHSETVVAVARVSQESALTGAAIGGIFAAVLVFMLCLLWQPDVDIFAELTYKANRYDRWQKAVEAGDSETIVNMEVEVCEQRERRAT